MEPQYEKTPSIVARKVAGELLLIPFKENLGDLSSMYTANDVGTHIWELLMQNYSVPQIIKTLLEAYEVEEPRLKEDVNNFLEQLVEAGSIVQKNV